MSRPLFWVKNGAWQLANFAQLSRALLIPTRITLSSSATNRLLEMPLKSRMRSRLPKRRHRLVAGHCLFPICNSCLSLYDRSSAHRWAFCDIIYFTLLYVLVIFSGSDVSQLLYYRNQTRKTLNEYPYPMPLTLVSYMPIAFL